MAQIATLLSDRARREGSAYVGRADLDLVEPLELGQVVIIEETSTGDRLIGWIVDVLDVDTETVYRIELGPLLPIGTVAAVVPRPRRRYGLQDVETMLDEARNDGVEVPQPREPEDQLAPDDA